MTDKIDILGVKINNISQEKAVDDIEKLITTEGSHLIVTPNPEMLIKARKDKQLFRILNSASLALPDGSGLIWASRVLGSPLQERVAGVDLVKKLLALEAEYCFYFLGGAPGVAEQAKEKIKENYSNLTIYAHHGYLDNKEEQRVLREIEKQAVDVLLVGMGTPLQEKWLAAYLEQVEVPVGIGVGGTFDVLAEEKKRAPVVLQRAGLEWFYRLYQEPKRWRRLGSLGQFMLAVIKQKLKR